MAEETKNPALEYPKAMYHATEAVRVVNSAAEEKALGAGWYANPNDAKNPPAPEPEIKRGPGRPPNPPAESAKSEPDKK